VHDQGSRSAPRRRDGKTLCSCALALRVQTPQGGSGGFGGAYGFMLIATKEALCSRMSARRSLRESKGDGLGVAGGGGAELPLARSRSRCLGLRSSHLCFDPASWRSTPEAGLGGGRGVSYLFPRAPSRSRISQQAKQRNSVVGHTSCGNGSAAMEFKHGQRRQHG
jgi:hypothetical protein